MENVRFEFRKNVAHPGVGQSQAKLRIKRESMAPHSNNAKMFKFGDAAIRRKDENLMSEFAKLADRLAECRDNAIHFRKKCLGKEGDSHLLNRSSGSAEGNTIRVRTGFRAGYGEHRARGPHKMTNYSCCNPNSS